MILAFILAQTSDLVTMLLLTGAHGSAMEGNPIARAILEQHGPLGVTAFKVSVVVFFLLLADVLPFRAWALGFGILLGVVGAMSNIVGLWVLR